MNVPHEPRPVSPCALGRDVACEPVERVFRAMDARIEASELRMVNHLQAGFAGISRRLDSMGGAIGELRSDLHKEVTNNGIRDERITHNEGIAARSNAVAEVALAETAKLGARKGRRRGRLESALVGIAAVLTYALARYLGVPVP